MRPDLVAAIDLGTNTCLLLVARRGGQGALEVVEDHARTPRLGEGLARTGALAPAAVERALEALEFFASRLRSLGVPRARTRVVATAVLRRARDADRFVTLARERTWLPIEIVSGEEEARLGQVALAAAGVGPEAVVVDVGGGSTEVSCPALGFTRSLPAGAVVLTESTAPNELLARAEALARELPSLLAVGRIVHVLGGTGLNLAALAHRFERFDPFRAEGLAVDARDARAWAEKLVATQLDDRLGLPIERERAEILPAGLALLAAILERLGAQTVRVTGKGLRYGIAQELLAVPSGT